MNGPTTHNARVILVEGESDRQVVLRLVRNECSRFDPKVVEVTKCNGIDNLISMVRATATSARLTRDHVNAALGIVADADDDIELVWSRLSVELSEIDLTLRLPAAPDSNGTVLERSKPRLKVGVWIMPNNGCPGELEDFLAEMIPKSNLDWPRAQRYVKECEHEFGRKVSRAEVLSWLATRRTPGRFDEAIQRGDLRTDGPLCQSFIAWLNRLFGDEAQTSSEQSTYEQG